MIKNYNIIINIYNFINFITFNINMGLKYNIKIYYIIKNDW